MICHQNDITGTSNMQRIFEGCNIIAKPARALPAIFLKGRKREKKRLRRKRRFLHEKSKKAWKKRNKYEEDDKEVAKEDYDDNDGGC